MVPLVLDRNDAATSPTSLTQGARSPLFRVYTSCILVATSCPPSLSVLVESGEIVVKVVATWRKGADCILRQPCDVAVIDLGLRDGLGAEGLRCLRGQGCTVPVVLLSERAQAVEECVSLGASGFLSPTSSLADFQAALIAARSGGLYLQDFAATPLRKLPRCPPVLRPREVQILQLIADGKTNEDIGEALHYSVSSVKASLRGLFQHFGVKDRTHLAAEVGRRGLVGRA